MAVGPTIAAKCRRIWFRTRFRRPSRIIPEHQPGPIQKKINDRANNAAKRVTLWFGSVNPIRKGHIALAESALEKELCRRSRTGGFSAKPAQARRTAGSGAGSLLAGGERMRRIEMSRHRVTPSAIEAMVDKPSYTLDTLRHLAENIRYADAVRRCWWATDLVPESAGRWYRYRGDSWTAIRGSGLSARDGAGQPLPDLGGRFARPRRTRRPYPRSSATDIRAAARPRRENAGRRPASPKG